VKGLLKLLLVLDCNAATLQMAPPAAVSMIQMMTQQHVMQQQLQKPLNLSPLVWQAISYY
jgi:hypothetical protein